MKGAIKKTFTTRIQQLEPSPTFGLDAKVKMMQKKGIPIINLGLGEPDFDTPHHIKAAAIKAVKDGFTHYTQVPGIPELKEAISYKFKKENHIDYSPAQIIVGSGSKPLLYFAFQTLCEKGDEVIVPTPTWSSYVEQIKLTQATPVFLPITPPFKLTAQLVEKKITPRTKVLLLNSPSNPTGAMIDKGELVQIAKLAIKHNFWIVTDEIYEKIIYGGQHVSIASLGKDIYKRTITINGFSKTYAMTGWRVGYAGGPQEVIAAMSDLQGQVTAATSSISQKAALVALTGTQKPVKEFVAKFTKRRKLLTALLNDIPRLSFAAPEGSFYFFIDIRNVLGKKYKSSQTWCEGLLMQKHVAVIPGEAFFSPGFFRLSMVTDASTLMQVIQKIKDFIHEN